MIPKDQKIYNLHYDVRGDDLRPSHGTTPAAMKIKYVLNEGFTYSKVCRKAMVRNQYNQINFFFHMLKWKLWKIRNKIKFDNLNFSVNQINEIIVSKIKDATKFIEKKN